MSTVEHTVTVAKEATGVVTVTLNRPQAANAMSLKLLHELNEAVQSMTYDRTVRCVIVTGAGDKAFCAGADLKERAGMNATEVRQTVALIRSNMDRLAELPQPVIAAVNGTAFGGGTELALACDIRLAAEHASFALTETSLGIIPGAGGTQRLARLVGLGRAKELIFTARRVQAEEAARIGLVEYVTPAASLMERAQALATQIASNAPIAVAQAKFAIDKGYDSDLHTGLAIEKSAYEVTIPTEDRMEGLRAFKEKRRPRFKGE
ncbi:enoyl-CoA hydratase [Numidum massiliense]|uniref:enoyl-CoA hydratase n=1 Tax=Numidum massiliense TaxID=1522315 RepID=UPI000A9E173E|nr:enoyl-CoA hydratase [Numidum massiliense]